MKIALTVINRPNAAEIQPEFAHRLLNAPEPEMPDWDEYLTEYLKVFGFISPIPLGELVRVNPKLLS